MILFKSIQLNCRSEANLKEMNLFRKKFRYPQVAFRRRSSKFDNLNDTIRLLSHLKSGKFDNLNDSIHLHRRNSLKYPDYSTYDIKTQFDLVQDAQ